MTEGTSASRPASRRVIHSERFKRRLEQAVGAAATVIHRERIRAWAAANEGGYPNSLDARVLAEQELAVLIRGLGALVEIEPSIFARDAGWSESR